MLYSGVRSGSGLRGGSGSRRIVPAEVVVVVGVAAGPRDVGKIPKTILHRNNCIAECLEQQDTGLQAPGILPAGLQCLQLGRVLGFGVGV